MSLLEQGTPASRRSSGTAKGNPDYDLGQVYDSIRVRLRVIPSVAFFNLQDLPDFCSPSEEYTPERQTLSINTSNDLQKKKKKKTSLLRILQLRTHYHPIWHLRTALMTLNHDR